MRRILLTLLLAAALPHRATAAQGWFDLQPDNTLVIDTTKGRIVVEMRPDSAPLAVARIRLLSREHVYDGLLFHRVLDHYVDQTGNPNNHDGGVSTHPNLPPEFFTTLTTSHMDAVATRASDVTTGFVGALPFAAAPLLGHPGTWKAWGAYCAGVAGMGRQADINTGNSEIFFMRESARRLDHDYTPWGRVVSGLDVVRAINVGEPPDHPDKMLRVRVMADLPPGERPKLQVVDTASPQFHAAISALRTKEGADFSICDVPIATQGASAP